MTKTIMYIQNNNGFIRLRKSNLGYIVENDTISRLFETYQKAKEYFNKLLNNL